jgi:membrane-associated protease RseP (regulator of RpoE activity)
MTNILFAYFDSPAYNAHINGSIIRIDSKKITSLGEFNKTISSYLPNQKINLETTGGNYTLTLAGHPDNSSKPFLGVSFLQYKESWLVKYMRIFINKKDPFTYYQPKAQSQFGSDLIIFIYNLLFWIVIINFSVALFNMVPLSIFDGGKFFYITILMLTKSKDKARKTFSIMSAIIFLFFIFITALWFFRAI